MKRMIASFGLFHAATFAMLTLLTATAFATPKFANVSEGDFKDIVRELSANSAFHSVTPASSMGSILGLEVGVIGGATETPDIDKLVKNAGASGGMKRFPHAGLLGVISTPFGFTGEVVFIPKINAQGVNLSSAGGAVKWVITDKALPLFPINVALKGFVTKTTLSFSQPVHDSSSGQDVQTDISFNGDVMGAQLLLSPRYIPVLEPYIGVGTLKATGQMNVGGSSTTNFYTFTSAKSAKSSPSTTQLLAGLDIRLLLLGIGFEYSKAFDTQSYTAKFSFKF